MEKNIIEISTDESDAKFIRDRLNEYNYARVPDDHHETLTLVARRGGEIVAGLTGDTYWDWLYISLFWVDEHLRGQGLGGAILSRAEAVARERGCHSAHLETHDFQNLGFYQKRGYTLFGQLNDLPVGHTKYFLWKKLQKTRIENRESRVVKNQLILRFSILCFVIPVSRMIFADHPDRYEK